MSFSFGIVFKMEYQFKCSGSGSWTIDTAARFMRHDVADLAAKVIVLDVRRKSVEPEIDAKFFRCFFFLFQKTHGAFIVADQNRREKFRGDRF